MPKRVLSVEQVLTLLGVSQLPFEHHRRQRWLEYEQTGCL
jgi:hypothetical protein